MRKCIYCGEEISHDSVIDFCEKCGREVFGEKMLNAIIENMSRAREKGNLYQGLVGQGSEEELNKNTESDSNNFSI